MAVRQRATRASACTTTNRSNRRSSVMKWRSMLAKAAVALAEHFTAKPAAKASMATSLVHLVRPAAAFSITRKQEIIVAEEKYDRSHHLGATPEERIRNRLKTS